MGQPSVKLLFSSSVLCVFLTKDYCGLVLGMCLAYHHCSNCHVLGSGVILAPPSFGHLCLWGWGDFSAALLIFLTPRLPSTEDTARTGHLRVSGRPLARGQLRALECH